MEILSTKGYRVKKEKVEEKTEDNVELDNNEE